VAQYCSLPVAAPLRVRLPERCPECGVSGRIKAETIVKAAAVLMTWCCHACGYEWLVTDPERERPERRSRAIDRRRVTRKDRRKPNSK
jgi:rubredoxin